MERTKACLQENGKLRLHKIISNEPAVLQAFDRSELAKEVKDLDLCKDDLPTQTSLGLFWDVNTDSFTFRVSSEVKPYTKRGVLSTINSLFDPVGFVAPVLIKGRLILRSCMSSLSDWDDPLPKELESIWREWTESLQSLRSLNIPRRYDQVKEEACVSTELHTFCDASKEAIGAVTYMRTVRSDGSGKLSFVLGKAKMAPHKGHTIPRLELCAAVLGTEVAQAAKEQLDINFDIEKYYTDSRIVLGYICNEERRFHVYVSNRVDRIRCVSHPDQWNHVGTDRNPADLATRSVPANELKHSIWISGPTQFDFHPDHQSFPLIESETDKELYTEVVTSKTHVTTASTLNVDMFKRFSSWRELVNSIVSFKVALRRRCGHQTADSTVNDLDIVKEAERIIIRSVQQEAYGKEIRCLQQEQKLHADSSILSLCPVLDTEGILRLEGRLKRTKCFSMGSNPIIIPKNQHIAVLLIRHFHENVHHQGRHITEGAVREGGFWIVGGKRLIFLVIHNCFKCRRLRGKTALQKMADLPEDRTMMAPPFSYVGIDTFGPWTVVSRRTRGGLAKSKRWAILFTCLVVRAIHIEAVEELSASSFINALRRFIALRGPVQHFISDRGTNFIGAARELGIQEIFAENREVQDFLLRNQIKWIFNTPHSSHHGGVWERLIGVSRRVLDSMLLEEINKNLSHEMLVTFLAEVCAVVNSRPLVGISTDPEAPEVLTPNLLLTQKPTSVDDMDLSVDTKNIYRRQWKLVQHLADAFWSRWKKEYLHTLQVRRKWQSDVPNIKENDIVLMKDDQVCRNEWPVAVVDRVFPSEDGRVRSVEIAIIKDGKRVNYVRPVTRLVVLSSD
ncbi:uncharacterized protein [Argopecten irradians]|uniref:uncharacterized protein n=1 Tax=Argopecten irradians TaxID=31199 RepID=UPI0037197952